MLTHLLAAVAYLAGDDGSRILFETPMREQWSQVEGIGEDPA